MSETSRISGAAGLASGRLAAVWARVKPAQLERLDALDRAALALIEGAAAGEAVAVAHREAHKLNGSLGSFGLPEGSRLAAQAERMLEGPVDATAGYQLSLLAARIRELVVGFSPDPEGAAAGEAQNAPLILYLGTPRTPERFRSLLLSRGFRLREADTAEAARELALRELPAAVVADLSGPERADFETLLGRLSSRSQELPILGLLQTASLRDRLSAMQHGVTAFLEPEASHVAILEEVRYMLEERVERTVRILALDDDPSLLEALEALLADQGFEVHGLTDPQEFWDRLTAVNPEVILLDVDMPDHSGLEICQALRSEPLYRGRPVIFLTAASNPETIDRVYAAGADDCVSKPLSGPKLLTRIENRLERSRANQRQSTLDGLTGLLTRSAATQILRRQQRLAERAEAPICYALMETRWLRRLLHDRGAAAGRQAWLDFGRIVQAHFREEDVVCRWEDDQFLAALYGATREDGSNRVRALSHRLTQEIEGLDGPVLAAGVAEVPADGTNLSQLQMTLESSLLEAVRAGPGNLATPGGLLAGDGQEGHVDNVDVAVVDDDGLLAGLIQHALINRGYRCLWIPDGLKAVEMLGGDPRQVRARVILLDIDLPGLNGLLVLQRLVEEGVLRSSRVIVLTVRSNESETLQALEAGAHDHVAKPFSLPVLLERVRLAMQHG